jgi:hypothetical protein
MPLCCAILDDYHNVALSMAAWSKVEGDVEVKGVQRAPRLGGPRDRGTAKDLPSSAPCVSARPARAR